MGKKEERSGGGGGGGVCGNNVHSNYGFRPGCRMLNGNRSQGTLTFE